MHSRPPHFVTLALLVLWSCKSGSSTPDADPSPEITPETTAGTTAPEQVPAAAERVPLGPAGPAILLGAPGRGTAFEPIAKRSDWQPLRVAVDTPYQIFEGQGTYVHVAAWALDGTPAAGATVFSRGTEVGTTDEHGTLVFVYPPPDSPGGSGSATGFSNIAVVAEDRCGEVPFNPYSRTPSFASDHLYVHTDRGVYRPGETIHVRTLGWHLAEDYGPLAAKEVEYVLRADAGETIGAAKRTTDEFGVAAVDFVLPPTVAEGLYHLDVSHGTERGSARLQVKNFKPPTIRIEHTIGRFITPVQGELAFEVGLFPGTGGEFGTGKIVASARAGKRERARVESTVKGSGPHPLRFDRTKLAALASALSEGEYAEIVLTIRDDRGREDTLTRDLRFVTNPWVAVLETDKDQYTTGEPVEIVAKVSDLDGVPLREGEVELVVDGGSPLTATTDASGMARFSLEMGNRNLPVELRIADVTNPIARTTLSWTAPKAMRSHIAEPIISEGGEASVVVRFPSNIVPVEKVVHLDVVDTSGALVNAVLLPIEQEDGAPVARGTFRAPSWGSMLLTFFALGRDGTARADDPGAIGLLTEGQNLVVQPDRELEILLDGLPETARPGSTLQVTATIRDPKGLPVEAALGAAIVDQRVIALKDPLEITPMDRFYNPELRTMSLTGSKMLTWPVVSRNWGGHRHDIALPPFSFKDGGEPNACSFSREPSRGGGGLLGLFGSGKGGGGVATEGAAPPPAMSAKSAPAGAAFEEAPAEEPEPDADVMARPGRDEDARTAAPPKLEITVRTNLPDTSLWAPKLRGTGSIAFEAKLPDTVGPQELMVVASDKAGGVGVARKSIQQKLPLWAEIDLPARLTAADRVSLPVTVHNHTGKTGTFTVELALDGATTDRVDGLKVETAGTTMATLTVAPTSSGTVPYRLSVRGAGHQDVVEGTLRVVPAGVPERTVVRGSVSRTSPWKHAWTVAPDEIGTSAFLRVSFPGVTTAFVGADALASLAAHGPLGLGGNLLASARVLRHARATDTAASRVAEIEARVIRGVAQANGLARSDGAFGYWRNGKPSAFVTAFVLEGLLEARAVGLPVDDRVIQRAASWLVSDLGHANLASTDDIAFWEGTTEVVRMAVTADVFVALARMPDELRTPEIKRAREALRDRFAAYVEGAELDALVAGRAIEGLAAFGSLDREAARRAIRRLSSLRDRGHWEPTWFHAWGGRVEATGAMIVAMNAVDPEGFAAELRDATRWLLATRDAWGLWHNERGTAAAIAGLLAHGALPHEVAGTITVRLDGREVERIEIDPSDPFMSTIALAHLSLSDALAPGGHTVEIDYGGALEPTVELVTTRWLAGSNRTAQGGPAEAERIEVSGPSALAVGETGTLEIAWTLADARRIGTVLVPVTAGLEIDLADLERTLGAGDGPADVRVTEHGLSLLVPPGREHGTMRIPVVGRRAGTDALVLGLRSVDREGAMSTLAAAAGPVRIDAR
jgi:hypothetical protein